MKNTHTAKYKAGQGCGSCKKAPLLSRMGARLCVCVHLVRLCLQVLEVLLSPGQAPVVGHVLLHHVVVGMLQQEGVGS